MATKTITPDTIRAGMMDYAYAARDGKAEARYGVDYYLDNRFRGQILIDSTGRKIKIDSITNAGFAGMQIAGKSVTESGNVLPSQRVATYVK